MNTNKDIWIGIIALAIISGVGALWLVESYRISSVATSMDVVGTAPIATSTLATTSTPVIQTPQVVNRAAQSVITVAEHIIGASEFASLMATSGVAALLKGPGPYTIFVPTNAAFSQLPRGTISKLSPAGTKRLVEYHIVSGGPSIQERNHQEVFRHSPVTCLISVSVQTIFRSSIAQYSFPHIRHRMASYI